MRFFIRQSPSRCAAWASSSISALVWRAWLMARAKLGMARAESSSPAPAPGGFIPIPPLPEIIVFGGECGAPGALPTHAGRAKRSQPHEADARAAPLYVSSGGSL